MILDLVLGGIRRGKARFACAAAGVGISVGAVVFVFSLAATNRIQAPSLAEKASAPWAAWKVDGRFGRGRGPRFERGAAEQAPSPAALPAPDLKMALVGATIDLRPGGRVLQGPPMGAVLAAAPDSCPYASTGLAEGRWVDEASAEPEVVCVRGTLRRFGRDGGAAVGDLVKFVGLKGTMTARLVGLLEDVRLPRGFPDVFANAAAFGRFDAERHGSISLWRSHPGDVPGVLSPRSDTVVAAFTGDEQRRMDYARPLMLIAAVLTALALLVNSLILSVEANRRPLAVLRTVGLTRGGVVAFLAVESVLSALFGLAIGLSCAFAALSAYVSADTAAFPAGAAFDWPAALAAALAAVCVALAAVLFAVRPALSVRPMDAASFRPRRRRLGMAVAFAFGFGSFAAVEVWGTSLMRGFVPSPEWPDAIVSLLPGGASSFDVEKLRGLGGVKRISELYPLQLLFPEVAKEASGGGKDSGRRYPANALFLAAEWLPEFNFAEGTHRECSEAVASGDACVISLMMSRARGLHRGDRLAVTVGGGRGTPGEEVSLPIAGVVDVNWHMVTSRGLVRGLNGSPQMTDGPVFVSLDTIESLDPRPAAMVRMTHLWVEYEPGFLAEHGAFRAGRIVEREIAGALGDSDGMAVRLHARDEIADGTMAHGSDLIGQAARVPFVFLAILSIGFVAMLVADADASKAEYVVLRTVGATRAQLAGRLVAGVLKTAIAGIVAGLPLGAAAGWLFAIKTASMWKGMPSYFAVPWRIVAEGAAGAVVFAMLVAVPTAMAIVARATRR